MVTKIEGVPGCVPINFATKAFRVSQWASDAGGPV